MLGNYGLAELALAEIPSALVIPRRRSVGGRVRKTFDPWYEDEFVPVWLLMDDEP